MKLNIFAQFLTFVLNESRFFSPVKQSASALIIKLDARNKDYFLAQQRNSFLRIS